nr:signal peptide peptidase SppA [uncultured Mucilaginibacter sp.]
MKQFFKFVLATILGIILSFAILVVFLIVVIVSASGDKAAVVENNSILYISLKNSVEERTPDNPLEGFDFLGLGGDKNIGLKDILANIKKAKTDDKIKGIFLDESYMQSGQATTEEIRNALIDFKKSGKFLIAYSEIYTKGFYYLASVADKIYLNPKGMVEFDGFNSDVTFYKGALDKLGIEAQVIKVGTYKSAVEPYILTKMSDANRLQVTSYINSLYGHYLTGIAKSRGINKDSLLKYADNLYIKQPEDALKYRLVDGLKYKDEIINELKKRTGVGAKSDLNTVDLVDYTNSGSGDKDGEASTNRIAMVYASGEIAGGEGNDTNIGSETLSKALRKVRLDDKVKAVVLRVNSPGGSSLASDVIWREVMLTRKVKPVIVSMGDMAASGGYYIACAADSIYAQPNTVTGSIGIFAILPNMQKLFNDKLGITFDNVKTGKYADMGSVGRPLTVEERAILQSQVNRGYFDFTKAVADGRHRTREYIDSIGQGRVWTGEQAIKIGLVDRLGNINDAVKSAAKMAKLKDYRVVDYPAQKSVLKSISSNFIANIRESMVKSELGEHYSVYQQVKGLTRIMRAPQARMFYNVEIK